MTTMSLRLPESLHQRARELAKEEGVSINQLIATALAEKISALDTVSYLKERASRGSREAFLAALAEVPSGTPGPGDELPDSLTKDSTRR
ncbi:MAG: type II toxin-antitoxin system HicB family antitoxin [Gemmatimonadota bacterium]|nr:type II toxin-antitoxin system HicB family antitoxin [Gemmatimonadota bacterium]MDH5759722.1 type II toxin-antitoxin system HicB family antitoxin [Gemmatimonadota bacterium]